MVRIVHVFQELWLLIQGLIKAGLVLIWAVLLLFVIVYMMAILMTEIVGHACGTDHYPVWEFPECLDLFGTMPRSIFTVFRLVTLDGWSAVVLPVIEGKGFMA